MANNIWAIPLAVTDFNIIVALLGGFISLFGLVSYLLKENYYMSEARECPLSPLYFYFSPIVVVVVVVHFVFQLYIDDIAASKMGFDSAASHNTQDKCA
jgi:hypothetical protein